MEGEGERGGVVVGEEGDGDVGDGVGEEEEERAAASRAEQERRVRSLERALGVV